MAATLCFLKIPILHPKPHRFQSKLPHFTNPTKSHLSEDSNYPQKFYTESIRLLRSASLPLTALTIPFFYGPMDACAGGGDFGILEGRTASIIHPFVMSALFLLSIWAGYLGWQWRRIRTIQTEINDLKKQVQPMPATPEGTPQAPPSPVEAKIKQLTEERKQLLQGKYRDKHFNVGSILLFVGIFDAAFGALNTWFRTGKLFPGPHLFAGTAITVLWAAAAALVPFMERGNQTARNLHIALNTLNVLLFLWQIPTGIDIFFKVIETTKWP